MKNAELLRVINIQGHDLPIYGTVEEPLFLAVDVAKMIDYSVGNTTWMLNSIDPDEKIRMRVNNRSTLRNSNSARGSASDKWFLTEYGLYEVLMQSRKPIARRFKSAVKDILRDLRLRGEGTFEDWMNHCDPLVEEWEQYCREVDDIDFDEWLMTFKGYTNDML